MGLAVKLFSGDFYTPIWLDGEKNVISHVF